MNYKKLILPAVLILGIFYYLGFFNFPLTVFDPSSMCIFYDLIGLPATIRPGETWIGYININYGELVRPQDNYLFITSVDSINAINTDVTINGVSIFWVNSHFYAPSSAYCCGKNQITIKNKGDTPFTILSAKIGGIPNYRESCVFQGKAKSWSAWQGYSEAGSWCNTRTYIPDLGEYIGNGPELNCPSDTIPIPDLSSLLPYLNSVWNSFIESIKNFFGSIFGGLTVINESHNVGETFTISSTAITTQPIDSDYSDGTVTYLYGKWVLMKDAINIGEGSDWTQLTNGTYTYSQSYTCDSNSNVVLATVIYKASNIYSNGAWGTWQLAEMSNDKSSYICGTPAPPIIPISNLNALFASFINILRDFICSTFGICV